MTDWKIGDRFTAMGLEFEIAGAPRAGEDLTTQVRHMPADGCSGYVHYLYLNDPALNIEKKIKYEYGHLYVDADGDVFQYLPEGVNYPWFCVRVGDESNSVWGRLYDYDYLTEPVREFKPEGDF